MRDFVTNYRASPANVPLGGYTFDILGLPYYGPRNGKDDDGQFFTEDTEFEDGVIDFPPIYYVHGVLGKTIVGKTVERWYDDLGGWFKVWLDPTHELYAELVDAHQQKAMYGSTGVVPASYDYDKQTGFIKRWLVGELSLVDTRKGYVPKNRYAMAKADVDVLMHDYYGDPVVEKRSMWQRLLDIIDRFKSDVALLSEEANSVVIMKADEVEETDTVNKCTECDEEAERLAQKAVEELTALQEANKPKECLPCRQAVQWTLDMVKANKVTIADGLTMIEKFRSDASTFETMKAAIEQRDNVVVDAIQKAGVENVSLAVHGSGGGDVQATVDEAFVRKMIERAGAAGSGYMELKKNG